MSSIVVLRIHPQPHCLSAWQLAELACGDAEPSAGAREHLTQCTRCHALLQEQQAEVERAAHDEIPAWLVSPAPKVPAPRRMGRLGSLALADAHRAAPRARRRTAKLLGMGAALALVAASIAAWVPSPPQAPTPMGKIALLATVLRHEHTIAQDTPVLRVPRLEAGDHLLFHVIGAAAGAHVQLDCREGDHWISLYDAALPAAPWLPIAVPVYGPSTTLRLKVCENDGTPCDEHTYEL